MRWLAVAPGPAFSVWDCYVGWTEALRELGEQVLDFPLGDVLTFYTSAHIDRDDGAGFQRALTDPQVTQFATDRLAAALFKIRPQVLFVVSGFWADVDVFAQARRAGTRVVLLHTESPYEDDRQLRLAPYVDLNLVNDPVSLDRFSAVGPSVYAPHSYRPALHHPGPARAELAADLTFVGTGYPSRVRWLEDALAAGLDEVTIRLAGNWMRLPPGHLLRALVGHPIEECLDNADAPDLYRSAKVGLNLYRQEASYEDCPEGVAIGPREVEMAACGMFFVRDPRQEGDDVWPMLPTFESPAEAADLIRWFARHDVQRQVLADQAREAIADRTFTHRARQLLKLLGQPD